MLLHLETPIYIAGHLGMVGSATWRHLVAQGYQNLHGISHSELDLTDPQTVRDYLESTRPQVVVNAAAKVGGIKANQDAPAEFLHMNLAIASTLTHAAYMAGIKRYLFLGSSCIYPKHTLQPICESQLLTGSLEPTNEAYAIAKIAGLKMCQYYREQYGVCFHSAMPTNLYGPGDNYDLQSAHVLPALIRKFHEAKASCAPHVVLWGDGTAKREFLHVDDLAKAILVLLRVSSPPHWVNVGTGQDLSIFELSQRIARIVGYKGKILTDPTKPNGTPEKRLDVTLMKSLGWAPTITLDQGIEATYRAFCETCH